MTLLLSSGGSGNVCNTNREAKMSVARREAEYDAILVVRFKAGDEDAFVEIMERYREKMFSIAMALLRNRADAEEIAQDTFIRAHRGLCRFRGDSSLATWLHRIVVNLARNRYWFFFRRRRHMTLSLDCALDHKGGNDATFADLIMADIPTPEHDAATGEFTRLVAECMEELAPRQREILTLRNLLNRSYREIATTLGIRFGTVKSRIYRARENLRKKLQERCPDLETEGDFMRSIMPDRIHRATLASA